MLYSINYIQHLNLLHYISEYYLFCLCSQWMVHNFQILLFYFFHLIILHHNCSFSIDCYSSTYIYICISKSHKPDFNIEVLNLIWPSLLCVPCASSFISTQVFVVNLDGSFGVLSNKFLTLCYSITMVLY